MITDEKTNAVYISALLPSQFPELHPALSNILLEENIRLIELQNTADIWCRDYMPVQVTAKDFVLFRYDPDYLKNKAYAHLRSDQDKVVDPLGFTIHHSKLNVDGGNLVGHQKKVILTDKVFKENPDKTEQEVLQELQYFLGGPEPIIIPKVPYDYTGHADGMVRFIDANTVLLNDFSPLDARYFDRLKKSLTDHGLNINILPWDGWKNKKVSSDFGDYINFLHVGDLIIVPTYNEETDDAAKAVIRHSFPKARVKGLPCVDLAKEGGGLHCCTWNIQLKIN